MDANELRALADALEPMAKAPRFEDFDVPAFCAWVRAQADAQPVPAVPAGWKVVPVEPTQAMNNAGLSAVNQYGKRSVWETYAAMLAAAPAAPQAMEDANVWKQIVPDDEPQAEPKLGELMREQRNSRIVAGAYPDGNPNAGAMMAQTRQAEPKRGLTCLWSRADDDTDMWETSCGHAFTIIDGTPTDNQMAFCCYCGRRVDEEIGGSDE